MTYPSTRRGFLKRAAMAGAILGGRWPNGGPGAIAQEKETKLVTNDRFEVSCSVKRVSDERYLVVRVSNRSNRRLSFRARFRQVKQDGTTANKTFLDVRSVDSGETMEQQAPLYWLLDWKRTEVYEVGVSDRASAPLDEDYVEVIKTSYVITK